ncbi:hypothetical protein Tco_1126535 [Tanacetum coccineum]
MGRDTIQLEDAVSTISQEYLLEFSSEYFIPENLHPELPGPGDHIVDFPEGKIGVYTKKIEFANFRIPISQFLFDILEYYQIHLSQLSVIGAAKVSHFKINCRVLNIIPSVNLFRVDEKVFPTVVAWRTAATKDDKPQANTYSVVDVATLDTHRSPFQKQPEELLCLVGLSRNFFLHDDEYPIFLNDNDQEMDLFNLIKAPNPTKVKTGTRQQTAHERDAGEEGSKAPAKVLRKDHDAACAEHSARGGKSLAEMSVDTELAIHAQETQEPPVVTQIVNDLDPQSYAKPRSQQDVTQSSKEKGVTRNQDSERSTPSPPITGSPGSIYQPGWGMPNSCHQDTPEACQDMVDHIAPLGYFSQLRHLPNDKFLSQYNINLARQVAMGSQLRLRFEQEAKLLKKFMAQVARRDQRIATREKHIKDLEAQIEAEINMKKAVEVKNSEVTKELEDLRMRFSGLEIGNAQLSQQVSVLQAQVMGEKRIMTAFEEFKKHKDERVNARCAEIDARLDALSVDFDEELQAFANVVSAGIAKDMSEGLKYGVEHGKAGLELTAVEAYDPEADNKYVAALHNLKDLNYPLIDELEQLKDAPPYTSSQLKIPVYPEVRNPRNPWACKDEILLGDAIAANISRAEKKKKSRVVCRTHGVGSAHHARSDGIPVSVPTVAPQGLQILLADAATQTEDEESPRLLRSKSLPALFTLDLP